MFLIPFQLQRSGSWCSERRKETESVHAALPVRDRKTQASYHKAGMQCGVAPCMFNFISILAPAQGRPYRWIRLGAKDFNSRPLSRVCSAFSGSSEGMALTRQKQINSENIRVKACRLGEQSMHGEVYFSFFYCKTHSTGKIYWGLSPTPGQFFKTGFVLSALNIPRFLIQTSASQILPGISGLLAAWFLLLVISFI